jgi:ubiquinone/menaquinone biosynthesis C-methylase UbiE
MIDILKSISAHINGFSGKKVLDVGSDLNGNLIRQITTDFNAKETVGLNLVVPNKELLPSCRLESGDIRKTSYEDHYFDMIISMSAFEHIQDFDIALAEMYRILKPGGYLYSHFGPIWSTSYGHHLWLNHQNQIYTYWNCILPPYCHLLMNPQTLSLLLQQKYSFQTSEAISKFVFFSEHQNQLMFEDYLHFFQNSKFDIIFFKGYDVPQIRQIYNLYITSDILKKLKSKYPCCSNFMYDGIATLLCK